MTSPGQRSTELVSVIIVCYNQASYLEEAISSVLAQVPSPEVVVVDDGSTDGSEAIVARLPGVTYIRQANEGVAAARNTGLANAHGEYVCFLDGDDRLAPGSVERSVAMLRSDAELAMVVGRCRLIDSDGVPIPGSGPPSLDARPYHGLLRSNCIWMPAQVVFRRSALPAGGFDPGTDHSCDYDLYLRTARASSVLAHDAVVAEWRRHPSTASHDAASMLRSTVITHGRQAPFVRGDPHLRSAYREGARRWRAHYCDLLVRHLVSGGRHAVPWPRVARDVLIGLRYAPLSFAGALFRSAARPRDV